MKKIKVEVDLNDREYENLLKHHANAEDLLRSVSQGVLKQRIRESEKKFQEKRIRLISAASQETQDAIDKLLGIK